MTAHNPEDLLGPARQFVRDNLDERTTTLAAWVIRPANAEEVALLNVMEVPSDLAQLSRKLLLEGRHPGVILTDHLRRPFDLLKYEHEFSDDPEAQLLIAKWREQGAEGVYYLPLVDPDGVGSVLAFISWKEAMDDALLKELSNDLLETIARTDRTTGRRSPETSLTNRERECFEAAARGVTEKNTAVELGISPATVRTHIENARRKVGGKNKLHAIVLALACGEIGELNKKAR